MRVFNQIRLQQFFSSLIYIEDSQDSFNTNNENIWGISEQTQNDKKLENVLKMLIKTMKNSTGDHYYFGGTVNIIIGDNSSIRNSIPDLETNRVKTDLADKTWGEMVNTICETINGNT